MTSRLPVSGLLMVLSLMFAATAGCQTTHAGSRKVPIILSAGGGGNQGCEAYLIPNHVYVSNPNIIDHKSALAPFRQPLGVQIMVAPYLHVYVVYYANGTHSSAMTFNPFDRMDQTVVAQ